jgi:membrane protease YdiL (CAAX protease family)
MSQSNDEDASGTWREGRFVRWQDVFVPVQATLVWFGLVMLAVAAALASADHFGLSKRDMTRAADGLSSNTAATLIATASFDVVLIFYAWRISRRVADSAMAARYKPIGWRAFVLSLAGGVALWLLSYAVNWELAAHSLVQFHVTAAERTMIPQSPASLPLGLLCIALIAPFAEELYFRGVLLSWLRRKIGAPLAVFASAAIFALLHFRFLSHGGVEGWVYTGTIAAVGLVTATLALRTGSLWGPFAVHAGYNAAIVSVVAVSPLLFR